MATNYFGRWDLVQLHCANFMSCAVEERATLVLLELCETFGVRRVLVLNPLSVWWGLKESADGKSPGFPIAVFGGPKADIPITSTSGHTLGELFTGEPISAVLDMGEMCKAEQVRLVANLLDHLFTVNREPSWLVLEEADAFAPQQPMGDMTRVLGEVDRTARRGRAFGFRLISITQLHCSIASLP
jgi:hypothetical protein